MVSFSMVHLRVLRSRLQLLTVSAQTPSPHSCLRINCLSIDPRSSTLPPSYCRRISISARVCQGPSSSSDTRGPVLPPVTAPRRRAGSFVAAEREARTTKGSRVETPKISKYRVDCNSPKVIKRKKKATTSQKAGTTPGSTSASVHASAPVPRKGPTRVLKPARAISTKKVEQAAAASKKVMKDVESQTTDNLGVEMAMGASGSYASGEQISAPLTPPTATVRKNALAGLPRPPSYIEPASGIGSDVLFATMSHVPKGSVPTIGTSSTSENRVFEREKANWPSQPPPKVGRTVYRTILDWSIHPTVQPGDFGSPVPLTPSPLPSFRTVTNGGRKSPPSSVSSFVQSITNIHLPAKGTPSTTTTNVDSGFTATGTRSRRRIGFEALDEVQELERRGSSRTKSKSNSNSSSRSNSGEFDSKSGPMSGSRSNSNLNRPRVQETRELSRAAGNERHKDSEIEEDQPKQESITPKRPISRHRRTGFDSLEEDNKAPPKNKIRRSSSRFSF